MARRPTHATAANAWHNRAAQRRHTFSPARKRWVSIGNRVSPDRRGTCYSGREPANFHQRLALRFSSSCSPTAMRTQTRAKQFYRRARLPLPRHTNEKTCVRCRALITHFLILRKPRPTPDLRTRDPSVRLCTTHVAVTHSPLDRAKTSRSNFACPKNSFAKFSTRPKYFVLVCRLFYFLKFSLAQAIRSRDTGGALH